MHVVPWLWDKIHSYHHWAKHPLSRNTYDDHWLDNLGTLGTVKVGRSFQHTEGNLTWSGGMQLPSCGRPLKFSSKHFVQQVSGPGSEVVKFHEFVRILRGGGR